MLKLEKIKMIGFLIHDQQKAIQNIGYDISNLYYINWTYNLY